MSYTTPHFALTCFIETISPVVFLNFFNCLRKYQNLDFATMASGAKIRILYSGVTFSLPVGSLRPITSNSFSCKMQQMYINNWE
jgi:hypothetical protein